jgi:1-pyrroline-4-hydroxy-2-carboxylate deaminase
LDWSGVLTAVTTPFRSDTELDLPFFVRHVRWLSENGIDGFVLFGSLGEGSTLDPLEKSQLLALGRSTVPPPGRMIAAISAIRTNDAVQLAQKAQATGMDGLLVLPPYVYHGDWNETRSHVEAVLRATRLPAALYNNPIAYGTDFSADQVAELAADNPTLEAVKESTGDPQRIAELRRRLGSRLQLLVGMDEWVRAGVLAGATGWVAGLANAFPRESVDLLSACRNERTSEANEIFDWFFPLLKLDSDAKFVQRIKYVSELQGIGSARVRPPRLELGESEKRSLQDLLGRAQAHRPLSVRASSPFPAGEAASVRRH